MSSKKKDLEMIYCLQWKNGPKKDDKKEMSVVVIFDIPTTTMNFELFKNYLLKNSGIAEDDVMVYFIMDNGKEYRINSQIDFQVALYAFRRKARAGEVITLHLEQISHQPNRKNLRHSNDVETQFDNGEPQSITSACCNFETPPEWFVAALCQLKKDITAEITANVSSMVADAVAELKPPLPSTSHLVKESLPSKHLTSNCNMVRNKKCLKKSGRSLGETASEAKDLIKSLKLENKLEKLERKASKYREKRMALQHGPQPNECAVKSSDSEAGPSSSHTLAKDRKQNEFETLQEQSIQQNVEDPKMDARPLSVQSVIPHMLGGETYLHQWEVQNIGDASWNSLTKLQYTWGSKKLVPVEKSISVPYLNPGEKGVVSARLHIPTQSGKYECYWQFMHNGRRFGHWLGLQVIVDSFDLKGHSSVLQKSDQAEGDYHCVSIKMGEEREKLVDIPARSAETLASLYKLLQDNNVDNVTNDLKDLSLERKRPSVPLLTDDSDCSWNSEPTHFWQKSEDKEDYVVVPVPQCFVLDTPESNDDTQRTKKELVEPAEAATDAFDNNNNTAENNSVSGASGNSIKLRDEDLDNIVVITVPKDEQVKEGFIYVHVDGQKVLVPKNILKSEVVNAAQELERSPSAANSVGVIIDEAPLTKTNKSPTPSLASTASGATAFHPGTPQNFDGNTLDSVPVKTLQEPLVPQQAIDLSTVTRDTSEAPLERSSYFEANNYMSHCSAAGSCFSEVNSQSERQNRIFVFPQNVPGYEVVYPALDVSNPDFPNLTTDSFVVPPQQEQAANPFVEPVPNFQQTPPEQRVPPSRPTSTPRHEEVRSPPVQSTAPQEVHILPEALVSGAVNVASSALNKARSVINMIKPTQPPGTWVNGHWVSSSPQTPREANLQALAEMGFWNRDLNATLLARFEDDLNRVVAELVQ